MWYTKRSLCTEFVAPQFVREILSEKPHHSHREDRQEFRILHSLTAGQRERPLIALCTRRFILQFNSQQLSVPEALLDAQPQLLQLSLSLLQLRLEVCTHIHDHLVILSDRISDFLPSATHRLSNWASAVRSQQLSVSQQHETESSLGPSPTFAPRTSASMARLALLRAFRWGHHHGQPKREKEREREKKRKRKR